MTILVAVADETDAGLVVATHDNVIADRLPTRWSMRDGVLSGHVTDELTNGRMLRG